MENPFLAPYKTPHGTVPFDQITLPDYEPAIREGMRREDEEIEANRSHYQQPRRTYIRQYHRGVGAIGRLIRPGDHGDV